MIPDKKGEEITIEEKINLIRNILFREDYTKIILNSFPLTIEELNVLNHHYVK